MSLLYKPFGLILGLIAGLLSRRLFAALWGRIDPDRSDPPEPRTREAGTARAVGAAALQAAVTAGVRAGVDRAGARGFHRVTGVWPGKKTDAEDEK